MGIIFDTVEEFFESHGWSYATEKDNFILSTSVAGNNGRWNCFAQVREEQEQFIFYSIFPVNASEDKLDALAEFITRANFGLSIGNFELDYSDGEIRFRTSIDVEGDRLSVALVEQLVRNNLAITDRYLPGVMAVLYGMVEPEVAIHNVEGSASSILSQVDAKKDLEV